MYGTITITSSPIIDLAVPECFEVRGVLFPLVLLCCEIVFLLMNP